MAGGTVLVAATSSAWILPETCLAAGINDFKQSPRKPGEMNRVHRVYENYERNG